MALIEPKHTTIEKTIQTNVGRVILENHTDFPTSESNLYCITERGDTVWQAEKPKPASLYIWVKLNEEGFSLSAYANTGHACEIDLATGKLISQVAFK